MKEYLKKNFAIVIAFALPIGLIAVIALITYLPSLFLSTKYNFVYSTCAGRVNYYYCSNYIQKRFSVENNKLVVNEINPNLDSDENGTPDVYEGYEAHFFLHNTQKNESREITFEEARALTLNNLLTSPDGVTVSDHYTRRANFLFLFDSGSSYRYYLTKGKSRSKLNLIDNDSYYYRNNFNFIGWVMPGRN